MDLEGLVLSEARQTEGQIPYDVTFRCNLKNKTSEGTRLVDTENRRGAARGAGLGAGRDR